MLPTKLKALLAAYLLILGSGLFYSCCDQEFRITSINGLIIRDIESVDYEALDTIRGPVSFEYMVDYEVLHAANLSPIKRAYATSCIETWVNEIEKESLSLKMNHDFIHNGDTIHAETNLLSIEDSGIDVFIHEGHWLEIQFTQPFFDQSTLEDGDYYFSLFASTSDDNILTHYNWIPIKLPG